MANVSYAASAPTGVACNVAVVNVTAVRHRVAAELGVPASNVEVYVTCRTTALRRQLQETSNDMQLLIIALIITYPEKDVELATANVAALNNLTIAASLFDTLQSLTVDQLAAVYDTLPESSPPPPAPVAALRGDPHLALAHGGFADFRGVPGRLYCFLSAPRVALNARIGAASFTMHRGALLVHGTFVTQMHLVAPHGAAVSLWTEEVGPHHSGWRMTNVTCDGRKWNYLFMHRKRTCRDASDALLFTAALEYSSLSVVTAEWLVNASIKPVYNRVDGAAHRIDLRLRPLAATARAPHGLIGQSFGESARRDGRLDVYPDAGEFTTSAMAEGAIDGLPADYEVREPYETHFRFSRFADDDATTVRYLGAAEVNTAEQTTAA